MIHAGLFRDVDAVLAWHPGDANNVNLHSSLANNGGRFRFYGVASHAAAAPERGRSALDGAMIMLNAVEFLREHVPQETRIHYIITNGGSARQHRAGIRRSQPDGAQSRRAGAGRHLGAHHEVRAGGRAGFGNAHGIRAGHQLRQRPAQRRAGRSAGPRHAEGRRV